MKKLLALLLALVMVFSLAACANGDGDKDKKDKDEKTEQTTTEDEAEEEEANELGLETACLSYAEDYDDFLNALPDMDTAKFMKLAAPSMDNDDFVELLGIFYDIDMYSEEQFLSDMQVTDALDIILENYGEDYDVKTEVQEATALTSDQISSLQDNVADMSADYQAFVDEVDGATEADWEAMAEADGLSVETEKRLVELCASIAKQLGSLEITEGYQLTIKNTVTADGMDDPEERVGKITVIKVNGEWMLLDGLAAYSVVSM